LLHLFRRPGSFDPPDSGIRLSGYASFRPELIVGLG
jgi:hypothetical protein